MRSAPKPRLAFVAPRGDQLSQLILEASPDFIYVYDRLEDRYLFASERCTSMLGYTPQQLVQLTRGQVLQLIHPEDLAHALAHAGATRRRRRFKHDI
jgi:PAS domain-containing protein